MKVCFYYGVSLLDLAIREATRDGAPWPDVPSHCSVQFGEQIFEMLPSGWNRRKADIRDVNYIEVNPPRPAQALLFAWSVRGKSYDWDALVCSLLGAVCPHKIYIDDEKTNGYDCSRFAYAVLMAAGVFAEKPMTAPSPYDVKRMLEDYQGSADGD